MNKRTRALLSVAMAIGFLLSCSEEINLHQSNIENHENDLVLIAKDIVNAQGSTITLPINTTKSTESRSGLLLTDVTPLWNNIKYYNIGDTHILMVNLQTSEEIFSRISTTKNGITETQESSTFSKLIIRKKGTDLYANVLTYLPESNYAATNKERLDTIGYYPYYVDFTGVTLTSSLDGTILRGIRYEDGKMAGVIYKEKPSACSHEHQDGETCNHEHSIDNYNIVNINLFTQSSQQPMSRASGQCPDCHEYYNDNHQCKCFFPGTGKFCEVCQSRSIDDEGYCWTCGFWEKDFCDKCGHLKSECICDTCPMCGKELSEKEKAEGHTCFPTTCPICGRPSCNCGTPPPPPGPDPAPDTCDVCLTEPCKCCDTCLTFPCICVTNTTPIDYVAHERDWIVGDVECVDVTTCCPMAVLEMAHKALGGTGMTQEMFTQFYTQINVMSPNDETVLEYNDGFMNQFFSTNSTVDISDDIELGNVVVIRRNGHYLLAFGLQYDGDVIYADLHAGELYAVNENYFNNCDYFTIDGLSSGEGKSRKIH